MAKRGRKPKTERTGYFYEREEEAFAKYITTEDPVEKQKIFNEYLHKPFCRMIESIIRRYKLYTPGEDFQDLFNDTMSFLMSKVEKFNVNSGFKAYSYCGTVCKNYLILKINQHTKKQERYESYDLMPFKINNSVKHSYEMQDNTVQMLTDLIQRISKEITKMLNDKEKYRLNKNEIKVGNALIELFGNFEELFTRLGSNKFNKSAILLFLKETTLLTTTEIRNAMKKYKKVYAILKGQVLEEY